MLQTRRARFRGCVSEDNRTWRRREENHANDGVDAPDGIISAKPGVVIRNQQRGTVQGEN